MSLLARRLDVPPDPLRIARALSGEPGYAFLWSPVSEAPSFVACRPVATANTLDPEEDLVLGARGPHGTTPRWIGLLPYESRRDLERPGWGLEEETREPPHFLKPVWARYGAVIRIQGDVLVVGDDRAAVDWLATRVRASTAAGAKPFDVRLLSSEPDAAHEARIRRALELIVEGQIYQVNLARRFDFHVEGRPVDLLERLVRSARAPFGIAAQFDDVAVVGSSPESFLSLDANGDLTTSPIKGTRPRGVDAKADRELARELDADEKERAELSMVVDVERNDLGRIATTGSVRVRGEPRVETFGSVHHRVATVAARLRPGTSRKALLEAMLPSGSVTGAPKIRAMEVIATLESFRRGLYTGAFGSLSHDGSLRLAMAIRTLSIRAATGHYFSGGGIVFGSDPAREVRETAWKAVQVLRLLERS